MAIQWTGIKRANEETAAHDDITPVANSGSPGDVVVGESTVFVKTTMYGDKWVTRFDALPEYSDPFKRGYVPCDKNDGNNPSIARFQFPNETAALVPSLGYSDGFITLATTASSSSTGYISGGYRSSSAFSTIRKMLFSVETDFTSTANLTTNNVYQTTGPCSSQRGYRCGGMVPMSGLVSTCDYITFSNDNANAVAIQGADKPLELAAAYNSTTKGYLLGAICNKSGGGYESVSTIRRLDFAANNQFVSITETTHQRFCSVTNANSTARGYQMRAYDYGVGIFDLSFRFTFASETVATSNVSGYKPHPLWGTTNSTVATYIHGTDNCGKWFFGTDTIVEACAYYPNPGMSRTTMALDTTDNSGFIF